MPSIISDFLDGYLKDSTLKVLVDPTFKIGSLIFQLETDAESQLTTLLDDPNDENVINLLYPDKSIIIKRF